MSTTDLDEIRQACCNDLYTFATLVNPQYLYGEIHKECFRWFQNEEGNKNKLLLLPRAHLKSHMAAVLVAWLITRNPAVTVLYISNTSKLAIDQLKAIKNILLSKVYRQLWPDMVYKDENKREKWTNSEICVDHPIRQQEGIRDATVFTAGLTTGITGLHADVIIMDDVVVKDTAYTEEGRERVSAQCSQLSSILNPSGQIYAVGTRYHPKDYWQTVITMVEDIYNEDGELVGQDQVYEVLQRVVEENGEFLWPRSSREDGKWFGFDQKVLARKKAEYTDKTQFWAQYYNDPNDPESKRFTANDFEYYERKSIKVEGHNIYHSDKKLNVFAGIDFAFSQSQQADFTAIAVIGVDEDGYIYVLDLDRFKTDKVTEYYNSLRTMYTKWGFKKLRAEVTVAQQAIVAFIKDEFRKDGLAVVIEEHRPTKGMGTKEERIAAILEPRYQNKTIKHFKGGLTPALEEEVILARPKHDDLKDALASVVEIAKAPLKQQNFTNITEIQFHPKFGGIAY